MNEGYYNAKGELVSKEAFDIERKALIAERFEDARNDDNMISIKDLDYYADELIKLWDK